MKVDLKHKKGLIIMTDIMSQLQDGTITEARASYFKVITSQFKKIKNREIIRVDLGDSSFMYSVVPSKYKKDYLRSLLK